MPRRKHPFIAGEHYHITNRHFRKENIIKNFLDTLKLEKIILKQGAKNSISLIAYSIMDTHIHLLVRIKENSNIPNFMMLLQRSYAQYFNCKYNKKGQVFTHNYSAKPANTLTYIQTVRKYITDNPLKKIHRITIANMLSANLSTQQNNYPNY